VQLLDLTNGQSAVTTADGDGSILLGAGTASNRYAIVAGDDQVSHGDGSITAGGGFWGDAAGLTGITAAQVGAVSNNAAGVAAPGGLHAGQAEIELPVTIDDDTSPRQGFLSYVETNTVLNASIVGTNTTAASLIFTNFPAGRSVSGLISFDNTNSSAYSFLTPAGNPVNWFASGSPSGSTNPPTLATYNLLGYAYTSGRYSMWAVQTNSAAIGAQ